MRIVVLAILLAGFWLMLSGFFKPLLLTFGVLSIALTLCLGHVMRTDDEEGIPLGLTLGLITYIPWLMWEIVKSSWSVAEIVLDPKLPISPTMTRVTGSQAGDVSLNVYANSITLTPGTITVLVDDNDLIVHALVRENADDLEGGDMDRRVARFEKGL
ncbi:MAG: Na+/H+ antiporter subunit E [Pseudomonadota bacterium]